MEAAVFWFLAVFAASDVVRDPVQHGWRGRQELRELECERLSQAEAHLRHFAEVPPTHMRSQALMELDALVCHRRIVPFGARDARDDAILSQLQNEVTAITAQAVASTDASTRFIVDAFYPQPQVAGKIRYATQQRLAESGRVTTTQMPLLAAADVEVLQGLPVQDALPAACARLQAEGSLPADHAFLAVALLREQETQLHAGLCIAGGWRWLR